MSKYHLNPETGKAGPCGAKTKCRFGEKTLHFDSKEAAQKAFELSMESQSLAGKKKSKIAPKTVKTNSNLDTIPYEDFESLRERMTERESNDVWNKDTIVRDWYYDARADGLNHKAALAFVDEWDDHSCKRMDEDYDGFNWEAEYATMFNEYKSGKKKV